MQPVIVQPKTYEKDAMKTDIEIPLARDTGNTYPFQWMLFKPQSHAITPFETNQSARNDNTSRKTN
jgi:hypothetical protein